jgi:hypothetical protein
MLEVCSQLQDSICDIPQPSWIYDIELRLFDLPLYVTSICHLQTIFLLLPYQGLESSFYVLLKWHTGCSRNNKGLPTKG